MKVLDPGHSYLLDAYDGEFAQLLTFMKREGDMYPGNVGHHSGTNIQEVLRVLIDRVDYLNKQIPSEHNRVVEYCLKMALYHLELRAAERHGMVLPDVSENIETRPACKVCGHVVCHHKYTLHRRDL